MRNQFESVSAMECEKEYIHPAVEHAHPIAELILATHAISPESFTKYDPKMVVEDMARVEKAELDFTRDSNEIYAKVLEAVLYDQIRGGEWFGPKAQAIKTSRYDDYFNGSDFVIELKQSAQAISHLGLSVDVTFGITTEEKKFIAIKENIDAGTLGEIKYFHSEKAGFRGELTQVPQVVIGVEKETVVQIAGMWAERREKKRDGEGLLKDHPVQRIILAEILLELQTFKGYAERTDKKNIADIYTKNIAIVEGILREKPPTGLAEMRKDKVFTAIRESMGVFK